jgi:hypothetical protein
MTPSPSKKPVPKKSASPSASKRQMPAAPPIENALPLKGKKVLGPKNAQPPAPEKGDAPLAAPTPTPTAQPVGNEKPLCWIELVKSGNVFIARSNAAGGTTKEYKNRVLEDMLTELIVELQEEIQE